MLAVRRNLKLFINAHAKGSLRDSKAEPAITFAGCTASWSALTAARDLLERCDVDNDEPARAARREAICRS